jgi:hypothetical protein
MDKKAQFLQRYANLPFGARKEIVVVIDDEPLTWNAAKIEIEQETAKGKEILDILLKLGILENE